MSKFSDAELRLWHSLKCFLSIINKQSKTILKLQVYNCLRNT